MITFANDHEAELWRSVVAAWIASSRTHTPADDDRGAIATVAEVADQAVLEYRKRCARRPGADSEPRSQLLERLMAAEEERGGRHERKQICDGVRALRENRCAALGNATSAPYVRGELDAYDDVLARLEAGEWRER